MGWLIPILLFVASVTVWAFSHRTDDLVVAYCRLGLAILLLVAAFLTALTGCWS